MLMMVFFISYRKNIEDEKVRYELDPGLNEFIFSDLDYDDIKIKGDEENDNDNGQGTS